MDALKNTTSGLSAGNLSSEKAIVLSTEVVAYCIVMPIICVIGILGNVANFITLQSPRLGAVSYMYLRALAVADMLCMLFVLVFVSLQIMRYFWFLDHVVGMYGFGFYQAHIMLPLINWAITASTLSVVALTVERYISVCWPLYFRQWNSPRRASVAVAGVFVLPFIMYVPMCWDSGLKNWKVIVYNSSSGDVVVRQLYRPYNANITRTSIYLVYKWTRETLLKFVPILLLALLNLMIILAFRKHHEVRKRIKAPRNQGSTPSQRDNHSLLVLLTGIVILFFICKIPAALNLILITDELKRDPTYKVFRAIANLLEITNNALNFYVFCLCSSDYRNAFWEKFPCFHSFHVRSRHVKNYIRYRLISITPKRERKKISAAKTKVILAPPQHPGPKLEPVRMENVHLIGEVSPEQTILSEDTVQKVVLPTSPASNETTVQINGALTNFVEEEEEDEIFL